MQPASSRHPALRCCCWFNAENRVKLFEQFQPPVTSAAHLPRRRRAISRRPAGENVAFARAESRQKREIESPFSVSLRAAARDLQTNAPLHSASPRHRHAPSVRDSFAATGRPLCSSRPLPQTTQRGMQLGVLLLPYYPSFVCC